MAGIAPARPLLEADAYERWVAAGMQGTMSYMERNAHSRRDIAAWYPEARSVLVCAFSYSGNSTDAPEPGRGRFARYARQPDYHEPLKERMRRLLDWLRAERPGADGRAFVDTSPILERGYARWAGIGWIGKNTMTISPRLGSYFLLAGLALNVELPPDEPTPDRCGSCTRCLDACPTEAFPRPRTLDASRCVAYLTIEHRGAIPEELRPGLGDWVFGCDVCQEVCPWNRFAVASPIARPVLEASQPLVELAGLDDAEFKRRFRDTPVTRAKRRGLLRNALLALGNAPREEYRPLLKKRAADPDPVVAEAARWSLARLK